jgi:hypothetical protein
LLFFAAHCTLRQGVCQAQHAATSGLIRGAPGSSSCFSDAIPEIVDAGVFGGIHFRTSCFRTNTLGKAVADYVSRHAMHVRGDDRDDNED